MRKTEEKRNPKVIEGAGKGLQRPLKVLDAALAGRPYLLGDAFTVADLNVAAVMQLMKMIGFTYAEHANVQRWGGCVLRAPGPGTRAGGAQATPRAAARAPVGAVQQHGKADAPATRRPSSGSASGVAAAALQA